MPCSEHRCLSMAAHRRCPLLLLAIICLLFIAAGARPSPPRQSLAAMRLQSSGMMECWDSLLELRACTAEVVLFFLNGETYLGPRCCDAIHIIEHNCWPSMLTSLGFTPEEGDILTDYCDADRRSPPLLPPAPPSPSPATSPQSVERV